MTADSCAAGDSAPMAEPANPTTAGGAPGVLLIHELVEALTAMGNYLTLATRLLDGAADPPETTPRDALGKGLVQFSRAIDAVRQLSDFVSKEADGDN
jgi:hypothetical protein